MISNDLYQEVILEHNKNPRNFKKVANATHAAEGYNPLCGDHIWVYLRLNDANKIEESGFEGNGCAICKASASMMTMSIKEKNVEEAKNLFEEFHALVTGKLKPDEQPNKLGKLKIFSGIWQYPARVKCAALAWHAMNGALENKESVSTE